MAVLVLSDRAPARAGGIDIGGTCCPIGKRSLGSRLTARFGFGMGLASVGVTLMVALFTGAASTPAATAATTTTATTSTTAYPLWPTGPQSLTGCTGNLTRDPQGDNWYDHDSYLRCPESSSSQATGNIIAFAVLATRQNIDGIAFDQDQRAGPNGSPVRLQRRSRTACRMRP